MKFYLRCVRMKRNVLCFLKVELKLISCQYSIYTLREFLEQYLKTTIKMLSTSNNEGYADKVIKNISLNFM